MAKKRWFRNRWRNNLRRWRIPWGGGNMGLSLSSLKFADSIYTSIIELITEGLSNTVLYDEGSGDSRMFAYLNHLFDHNHERVVVGMLEHGEIYLNASESGIFFAEEENDANVTLQSNTFKTWGVSDRKILDDVLKYMDNILNASNTSIKRMGVLPILTPQQEFPIDMTEEEIKEFENDLSKDYGNLDDQTAVKIMRKAFNISTINLSGGTSDYDRRLQTAVKIVCSKLRVPYELLPAGIVGNPNQTGVYQEQALVRLYATVESWVRVFAVELAGKVGLTKVGYDILTKPQDNRNVEWEANKKQAETIKMLIEQGVIDKSEARELVKETYNLA